MTIQESVELKDYTTFKIGGPAKFFAEIQSIEEATEVLNFALEKRLELFILGGGSNLVVSDNGFDGLVIKNNIKGIGLSKNFITASAGENWDDLVRFSVQNNLSGIECLSWVPGTVGGAAVQNIGCYGQSFSDAVFKIKVIDIKTKEVKEFLPSECQFGYRESVFKKENNYLILEVTLKLSFGIEGHVAYQDLVTYFEGSALKPSVLEIRNALFEIRSKKGMVVVGKDDILKSAGSFFKNPVIGGDKFTEIFKKVGNNGNKPWFWKLSDGSIKISAAKLISLVGFEKGTIDGNVGVSLKQPLAIINLGNCSAFEIKRFSDRIISRVQEKFNVKLEPEVVFIGKF